MEAERIRQLRKEKRITIVELADRMGVSQSYISRLELGHLPPISEQLEVIEEFITGRL